MRNKPIWEKKKVTVLAGLAVAMALLFCLAMSAQAVDMGEIHSAETRTGNIAYEAQIDSFTFNGEAGQTVIIQMCRESGSLYCEILLYAPNGTEETSVSGSYTALISDYQLQQSGLYTIVVMDDAGQRTGEYSLSLLLIPGSTTSPQDADGGDMVSGETKTGTIDLKADTDAYNFNGEVNQTVIIQMSRGSGLLDFECEILLYAPDGTEETSVSVYYYGWVLISDYQLQQSGLYTIVVKEDNGLCTGEYSLSLLLIPGATTSPQDTDGGDIVSGETKVGTIDLADTDAYNFNGEVNQTVIIQMSRGSGSSLYCVILLYAPDGTEETSVRGGYHDSVLISDYQLQQSGLYTIVVMDDAGQRTGEYSLSLTKIPAAPSPGAYNPFPANGATITDLTQSFSWDAVAGATGYDLYFGEDVIVPLEKIGENLSSPEMSFPEMEWGKVYYWHVEAHIPNGTIQGPYWWFKVFSEQIKTKSEIHVHKEECLSTYDTHIDHNKIYNFTTRWDANVWEVENLDNVTYTITTAKNFTYIDNWELYKNGTENSFVLPPTIEGQNYMWVLPLKDRIGSDINFVLDTSQTVQDNPWVDMDVNTTDEGDYTRVNVTFTPMIPLGWSALRVRGDQIMAVSAYPSEFEVEMLTSNCVKFDSGDIHQDHVYNFSVLVDNPNEVSLWLEALFGWEVEPPSNVITLPVAELGSVTVKADVPVIWEHRPTLPQYVQSIAIKFEEVSTPNVSIRSKQDFMERKYVANGSFSSSLSDMTYRQDLRIYANSGQFVVPKVVIFNTTSINLDRTFYKVDGVSMGHGNITAFPDHIKWTGNNETVSSYFELGIYELNTHELTPPFSSSRSIEKEVFEGNETIRMTFNATPTNILSQIDFLTFTEETNDAYSKFLVDTATNPEFIEELSSDMIEWEFDDPVIGQTYSASVNLTVTPKTASTTRYWTYLKVEGDYGSFTYSNSGSSQSLVEYTDSILGDVQIYFENPVDYTIDANGKGTYYERFKQFSEIVEVGEPHTIGISRNAFKPGVRTVSPGTAVRWTNWEDLAHTVTSDTGLWDSGSLSRGQSFYYTFNTPGTYTYHDALHPSVTGVVKVYPTDFFFDTGEGTYPSIMGRHEGTVTPSCNISVSKLYTYPCPGTGGHSEYAAFYYPNGTLIAEANWTGYSGDWHNILFLTSFSLEAGKTYNYTIRTGSYPQIIHNQTLTNAYGTINCTEFIDANGKEYKDWIPAIRLE